MNLFGNSWRALLLENSGSVRSFRGCTVGPCCEGGIRNSYNTILAWLGAMHHTNQALTQRSQTYRYQIGQTNWEVNLDE